MLFVDFFFLLLQRITIPEILKDEWFIKGYKPPQSDKEEDVNLDDVDAVFNDSKVRDLNHSFCFNSLSQNSPTCGWMD